MTATETTVEKRFVPAILPWLLGAGALAVYILTLNPWLSLSSFSVPPLTSNSLAEVARVSGWIWQPALSEPLYWLVTYPFRWLPEARIPMAMNLFAAACGAMSLALLARSIALLPHDRTEEQRNRERSPYSFLSIEAAWLPPTLAVIACGLQLSFWENATVASGEMFNLLLFAYVTRCLLEYRQDGRQRWLTRAAFIFAASMANNWAMVAWFPAFLIALVWIQGLSFFNVRFLTRMAFWGLAGLLFYLLLPVVAVASAKVEVTFWQALKYNIGTQKSLVFGLPFNKAQLFSDRPLWVLALPSLLPLLVMSIRWPSYFGDPSRLGVALATLIFHFFHGVLLLVCIWVMLDPQFSPRNLLGGTPALTIYYLAALGIGYFAGYFLLVFGVKLGPRQRPGLPDVPIISFLVRSAVWLLLPMVPFALLQRNLDSVRATNAPLLRDYAMRTIEGLPESGKTVLLSDDFRRLVAVRSALGQNWSEPKEDSELGSVEIVSRRSKGKFMFVDTASLPWPDYHRFLAREYPGWWTNNPPRKQREQVEPPQILLALAALAQSNDVYYLHPSFGYYFELFSLQPRGLAYQLRYYSSNALLAPPASDVVIAENELFWKETERVALPRLLEAIKPLDPQEPRGWADRLLARAHVKKEQNRDGLVLGSLYSRAQNYWGTELQRAEEFERAGKHFQSALELNPENIVAQVNLAFNENRRAGKAIATELSQAVEDQFGKYRNWDQVMGENGPFDEPVYCMAQGQAYLRGGLYRQAAYQFDRVRELAPNNLSARLWLAQIYVLHQRSAEALKLVEEIRQDPDRFELGRTNEMDLVSVEASAYLVGNNPARAKAAVNGLLKKYPNDEEFLATATQIYMNFGQFTNAVEMLERQLRIDPGSVGALVNKGYAYLQIGQFEEAIAPLTKALSLETNTTSEVYYSALFNRAIAFLRCGKGGESQRDYEVLQKAFPTSFKIYYGLGELAFNRKDTNSAIRNYELYLQNAPTNTSEARFVSDRLKALKLAGP